MVAAEFGLRQHLCLWLIKPRHQIDSTVIAWPCGIYHKLRTGLEQYMTQTLIVQKPVPPFYLIAHVNNSKTDLKINKSKWGIQGLTDPAFCNWTSLLLAWFVLVLFWKNCSSRFLCIDSPVERKDQSYTVGFRSALLWLKEGVNISPLLLTTNPGFLIRTSESKQEGSCGTL